jgi:hypothetical protein
VGALGLATGAVLAFEVQAENGEAKALCPRNTCPSLAEKTRHDTLVSNAHRDQNLAIVSAGIAGAALLAAAVLWWRPARSPSPKASVGPPGAWLGGRLEVAW